MNIIGLSFILIPFLVSFFVAVVLGPVMIPWLRRLKFGQQILEDGPKWHEKKSGYADYGRIYIYSRSDRCGNCRAFN